jgi:hypothetical protein
VFRPLPYPGYSWSFTQHAIAFDAQTIYLMLQSALPFEGGTVRCGEKITALMEGYSLLTRNVRGGVASAWRDYQQVLSEFGLLYSTDISQTLRLTDLGHMYVAGSIGYSETLNQQVLRYQYPNGQKHTIQSRLRGALAGSKYEAASSVIELQMLSGVLIKPGLLMLRVMLGLLDRGYSPDISVFECRKYLMPSRTNTEWQICVQEIVTSRLQNSADDGTYNHATRNIQDWFKFMDQSDLFERTGNILSLSAVGQQISQDLLKICIQEEDPHKFWLPSGYSVEERLSWFSWFGSLSLTNQPSIPQEQTNDPTYINDNFVRGMEDSEGNEEGLPLSHHAMTLSPVNFETLGKGTVSNFQGSTDKLLDAMLAGLQKQQAKAILHDQIVKELAEKLQSGGAEVSCGAGSIDLFARWSSGCSAIFEVKTVTKRSLQSRLRSAIGQLHEYQYRRLLQGMDRSDLVVAINGEIDPATWQSNFVTEYMRMGLLCKVGSGFSGVGGAELRSLQHWSQI